MNNSWRRALDRLGIRLRTIRALLVLGAIAFALAFLLGLAGSQRHTVSTTVFVARVLPGQTTGDVDASIADFVTVIGLPIVRDPVAEQVDVPASVLDGVSVERIQTSSAVKVSYTGTDVELAKRIVEASAREGLRALAQQQVDGASGAAEAARSAADEALKAVTDFEQGLGVVDFDAEYQRRRQDLLNLQAQAVTSPSAALTTLIAQRTAEVDKLAAAVPTFNQLNDRLSQARAAVADASKALTDAQGKLSAASAPSVLTDPDVVTLGKLLPAVRSGVLTAVLVVALGFGLALLEVRVRQRRAAAAPKEVYRPPSQRREWWEAQHPIGDVEPAADEPPPAPASYGQRLPGFERLDDEPAGAVPFDDLLVDGDDLDDESDLADLFADDAFEAVDLPEGAPDGAGELVTADVHRSPGAAAPRKGRSRKRRGKRGTPRFRPPAPVEELPPGS